MVAPRFTPPGRGSGGVGLVRVVLLAYRNAAEAEPRTRIWLDGSSMYRVGDEAVLVRAVAGGGGDGGSTDSMRWRVVGVTCL